MSRTGDEVEESGAGMPEAVIQWLDAGRPQPPPDAVRAWLDAMGEAEVEALADIWAMSRAPEPPPGLADIRRRLDAEERPATPRWRRGWAVPLRAAALLVIGLGLGLLWPRARDAFGPARPPVVVEVPNAATATLELPGGVRVRLNAATRLSYRETRGRVEDVSLDGEAFFQVEHDPDRPFRVHTAAGIVSDLGTEFNVRARENRVAVVVTEGVVALEGAGRTVTIAAGQVAHAVAGAPPSDPEPAGAAAIAWTEGRLVAVDEPLTDIAAELGRRYGVQVTIGPGLAGARATVTIGRTADARDAVQAICMAIAARCTEVDGGWTITKQ